ncbi:MAG: nuclease-related domain-containing protein [Roseiflexaceae bacterium]
MAVQIWIGEKPEHPNERRAITQLATQLARLDGLYVVMVNFSVGGRTIDAVILKHDGFFVVELKHCDGRVIGDVNGPWFVENSNGERKRLNPGRKNPYNQVIAYYYAFSNFLGERRNDITANKNTDTRSLRRVVAIAPSLHPDSQIDTDWKVQVIGLDELPVHVFTECSTNMAWNDEELQRIPQLLNCTRWDEIEHLVLSEITPPAPPIRPRRPILAQLLSTWTGQALIAVSVVLLVVALWFAVSTSGTRLVTLPPMSATVTTVVDQAVTLQRTVTRCSWDDVQTIMRTRASDGSWQSVASDESADVLLTLYQVSACNGEIRVRLQINNKTSDLRLQIPLDARHVQISDSLGTNYEVADVRSQPSILQVDPDSTAMGVVVVSRGIHPSATTLTIALKDITMGDATWIVPLVQE